MRWHRAVAVEVGWWVRSRYLSALLDLPVSYLEAVVDNRDGAVSKAKNAAKRQRLVQLQTRSLLQQAKSPLFVVRSVEKQKCLNELLPRVDAPFEAEVP